MAVDPILQRMGVGSAVLSEAIRGLKTTNAVVLWANGRDTAIPFYDRGRQRLHTPPQPGGPHHLIEPDLTRLS